MQKVGIIGYGNIGKLRYKHLKRHSDFFKVVAISDLIMPDNLPPNVKFYTDYAQLINDVDVVFIATPHKFTARIVIDALKAGKHVFSEKPPGINLAETKVIIEEEKKHPSLKLKFGFNHRYHKSIIDAYKIVKQKQLGDVLWLRGVFGKSGLTGWRGDKGIAGGGILLGQGIHMLDIFNLFCGHFDEVKGFVHINEKMGMEDNVFAILRNEKGQMAELHSSATLWKKTFVFRVGCESGYIEVNGFYTSEGQYGPNPIESLTVYDGEKNKTTIQRYATKRLLLQQEEESWNREICDFEEAIKMNKVINWGSSSQALAVMKIIEEIYAQK